MFHTEPTTIVAIIAVIIGIILLASGLRTIRPTTRAVIERFGKYTRFRPPGITWVFPGIEKMYTVNITEQMTDATQQEIITLDNLNAIVDAQVYFKVRPDEQSVKASFYSVNNYERQIVALTRTTLRNVIGSKNFAEVNSKRGLLNTEIRETMEESVLAWGVEITRCELKQISPPQDVQETMNRVLKAQNEKEAAIDYANAKETEADGERRAAIKLAEGKKRSVILNAEGMKESMMLKATGEAQAIIRVAEAKAKEIEVINIAAQEHFKDNAVVLKTLEVNETALKNNSKIILTNKGMNPSLIIGGDSEGRIIPVDTKKSEPTISYSKGSKKKENLSLGDEEID